MVPFRRAAFYFVAHADDWQLFMTPEINNDIADGSCKVIIIHTTAGDAGREEAYWRAREKAAIDSLLFRLSFNEPMPYTEDHISIGNKKIFIVTAGNCVCYFLRLPDGNYNGSGFERQVYQSLEKFQSGDIDTVTTVDALSVYKGWDELVNSVDQLVAIELGKNYEGAAESVWLNFPEADAVVNPHDHNDHYATSKLVQCTSAYNKYNKRAFLGYHIIHSDEQLTGEDLFRKIGMFCAYHYSLYKLCGHSTIAEDRSYIPWCFKNSRHRIY